MSNTKTNKVRNSVLLTLKLLFIAAAITLIISKTDTQQIWHHLASTHVMALVGAYLAIQLTHFISAFRNRYYFAQNQLQLHPKFTLTLYYVGLFYNSILPGGITGDGYKIYKIGKLAKFSKMKALRILLSDRASGLFMLLSLALILGFFSPSITNLSYAFILLTIASITLILGYFISIKLILKETAKTALGAMRYSFFIQGIAVLAVVIIVLGMGQSEHSTIRDFAMLFLLSGVVSVIPISIGGAGLRELTFLYGAPLIGLSAEIGIALALIYFVLNLLVSATGMIFLHKIDRYYQHYQIKRAPNGST